MMKIKASHSAAVVLVFFALFLPRAIYAADKDCLPWHPDGAEVTGTLIDEKKIPNQYWMLHLEKPVCVSGLVDKKTDFAEYDVRKMQVLLNRNQYETYSRFLNRKVVVKGILYPAHMPHHLTNVLLAIVEEMKPVENHK